MVGNDAGGQPAGPQLRTALAVIALGVAVAVVAGVGLVLRVVSVFSSPAVSTPADLHRHLRPGTYEVYERTGSKSGAGGFSFTNDGPVTITPADVAVVGPDGRPVAVGMPGTVSETVTRGSQIYTGAVRFTVVTSGVYDVRVRSTGGAGEVVVAETLGSTFRSGAQWFGVLGLGVFVMLVGFLLLLIGVLRRRSARPTASTGLVAAVPPGWHPDPYRAASARWWDGTRWTEHTR